MTTTNQTSKPAAVVSFAVEKRKRLTLAAFDTIAKDKRREKCDALQNVRQRAKDAP
jgi:hypothetical protein